MKEKYNYNLAKLLAIGEYARVYLMSRKSDNEIVAAKKFEIDYIEDYKIKLINQLVTQLSVNNLPCVLPIFDIFAWVKEEDEEKKIIVVMYMLAGDADIITLEGFIDYYRK